MDECAEDLHNCGEHSQCVDEVDGFSCECDEGFLMIDGNCEGD